MDTSKGAEIDPLKVHIGFYSTYVDIFHVNFCSNIYDDKERSWLKYGSQQCLGEALPKWGIHYQ